MITFAIILSLSLPHDSTKLRQKTTQKIVLNKLDSIIVKLEKLQKNEKTYSYSSSDRKRSVK